MTTLYGTLIAALAKDYERSTRALHAHTALVNRFGDEVKSLELMPHAHVREDGELRLVACAVRGQDHGPIVEQLFQRGYRIGPSTRAPNQFTDGYIIWTAPISNSSLSLSFSLLYYTPWTPEEASAIAQRLPESHTS